MENKTVECFCKVTPGDCVSCDCRVHHIVTDRQRISDLETALQKAQEKIKILEDEIWDMTHTA